MNRFRQQRRTFCVFVNQEPSNPLVVMYKKLMAVRVKLWSKVLQQVLTRCQHSFMEHSGIAKPEYLLGKGQYLDYLHDAVIGHVDFDGCIVDNSAMCDGAWLRQAAFVWKA